MELRKYQQDLLDVAEKRFRDGDEAVMLQLATGGGKTAIAATWARQFAKPVLFLCHTLSVIGQVPGEFRKWGTRALPVGSGFGDWDRSCRTANMFGGTIACTAATAANRLLATTAGGQMRRFGAVIVDEAHHAPDGDTRASQLVRRARMCNIPVLGLTATPWRMSTRQGFNHTWSSLICGPSWRDLLGTYLADVTLRTVSDVIKGAGAYSGQDYKEAATREHNRRNPIFREGAFDMLEQFALRDDGTLSKTLMYAVGQKHALKLASIAVERQIPTGLLVSSSEILAQVPPGVEVDQHSVREGLRGGALRLVINVNMVTEGYDCPDVETVICLRPTMSLALWKQICGRGSRKSPDKSDVLILDLTDNHQRLGDPLADTKWSLLPREVDDDFVGEPWMRYCVLEDWDGCGTMIHTAHHRCPSCRGEQGRPCSGCGKYRFWGQYEPERVDGKCESCREADAIRRKAWAMSEKIREPKVLDLGTWGTFHTAPWLVEGNWQEVVEVRPRRTRHGARYYTVLCADGTRANAFKKYQRAAWKALDQAWASKDWDALRVSLTKTGGWNNVDKVLTI